MSKSMEVWLLAIVVGIMALSASADLLVNSGFENGLNNWWEYGDGDDEGWAARSGTNGYAFYAWIDGGSAGVGQNVSVTSSAGGDIYTWTCYGLAESDYTASKTFMKMEFWRDAGSTLVTAVTNDISLSLSTTWQQFSMVVTNMNSNVDQIRVGVHGEGFSDTGGTQAAKWDDFEVTSQSVVPEPITGVLMLIGIFGALTWRRRQRQ